MTSSPLPVLEPSLQPRINLILARASNGTIGKDNRIPWHIPGELAYFKRVTLGHPIVMGRKTWDSLPRKPLPGRPNLVVTRNAAWQAAGAQVATTINAALLLAGPVTDIFVIGGAEIYRATRDLADRLFITEIHAEIEGDSHFADPEPSQWQLLSSEHHPASTEQPLAFSYRVYQRLRLG